VPLLEFPDPAVLVTIAHLGNAVPFFPWEQEPRWRTAIRHRLRRGNDTPGHCSVQFCLLAWHHTCPTRVQNPSLHAAPPPVCETPPCTKHLCLRAEPQPACSTSARVQHSSSSCSTPTRDGKLLPKPGVLACRVPDQGGHHLHPSPPPAACMVPASALRPAARQQELLGCASDPRRLGLPGPPPSPPPQPRSAPASPL
jgi:hypothetical protein